MRELSKIEEVYLGNKMNQSVEDSNVYQELTEEDIKILCSINKILVEEEAFQLYGVLLPIRTVGIQGDKRTYWRVTALRNTMSVFNLDYDLEKISLRITNEIIGINRVVLELKKQS